MQITQNYILQSAMAENTRIAYEKGWQRFSEFCATKGYDPLPATPQSVSEFLIEQATQPVGANGKYLAMGSVILYRSAINRRHTDFKLVSPTRAPEVINVIRGLKRIRGTACRQVKALREYDIEAMIAACPITPIGVRDAAIMAIGFAGALRRSELCNLQVEDLEIIEPLTDLESTRMFIYIRKSKTDQDGTGQKIAILEGVRIKPIQRLKNWLNVSGIVSGHVFQSMKRGGGLRGNKLHHSDIPRIVKHYAALIGLDTSEIAGHSLRAGFVTSAAAHQARLDKIMEITRHRNPATVMKYIRDADAFTNHAGEQFL